MSESEGEEIKDWFCNNPTEDEIRFNDDSDLISSDDSDNEKHSGKPFKFNQLNPLAKRFQKCLCSTRPEGNKNWRRVASKVDLLEKYTGDEIRSNIFCYLSPFKSNVDKNHSIKSKQCYQEQPSADIVPKYLHTTLPDTSTIWRTVESKVDLLEKNMQSDLESVSSERMAKSQKRKRDISFQNEGEGSTLKKIRTNDEKEIHKSVIIKHKENTHTMSSSEDEKDSGRNSTRIESKGHRHKNKPNRNSLNTHLLSSESDSVADLSHDLTCSQVSLGEVNENGKYMNNECESSEISDEEMTPVKNIQKTVSNQSSSRERPHRKPKFTNELNEEISKFSSLLDENLIEKNDIWILQCPSSMDCSALVSQRLSLGASCQLHDGEKTYETYSYRDTCTRSATLAVPSEHNHFNLRKIPITGNIIVEESVRSVKNTIELMPEPPSRVELPDNLRTRHPLLGIDFTKQPRTTERAVERVRKKKKHSKKHGESHDDNVEQLVDQSVDDNARKRKKKKKHKNNDSFN